MKLFLLFLLYCAANMAYDYTMNLFEGMTYEEALRSLLTYFVRIPVDEWLILLISAVIFIGSCAAPSLRKRFGAVASSIPQQAEQSERPTGTQTPHKD
jgi:hypothetical protein